MANENTIPGFLITCNSCAARLKVNKPSLVGQMLACPKCGTMLKVVKPANRPASNPLNPASDQPPQSATGVSDSIAPTTLKTMLTTGDFDEIEQLLISNPQLNDPAGHSDPQKFKTSPGHQPKASAAKVHPLTRPKPSGDPSQGTAKQESDFAPSLTSSNSNGTAPSNPLLPSDQWISPTTQKRRQMMTLLAAAISLILVLLTIVIFLLNGFGSKSSTVAKSGDSPVAKIQKANDPPNDSTNGENPDLPAAVEPIASETPGTDSTPTLETINGNPDAIQVDLDNGTNPNDPDARSSPDEGLSGSLTDAPPSIPIDEPPPILTDESPTPGSNPVMPNELANELPDIPAPGASAPSTADPTRSNPTLSNLDRLSQMVEGSQLSIGRFKDLAASARDDQRVGLPKYFVEKNSPAPVDTAVQLSVSCSYMKYDPLPLSIVLQDLMSITGVPMTIDVDSVIALHGSVNPKVELNVQGVDFSQAIDALLQSAELIKLHPEPSGGLLIAAGNRDVFKDVAYDLPKFVTTGEEDNQAARDELANILQGMIAPDSWKLEQNPARLSFADSQLTVINSPVVQFRVRELLHKVGELIEVAADSTQSADASKLKHLPSKLEKIQAKLELPSGLEHRFSGTLVDLLDTLSTKTGVIVLADWEALRRMGFGPLTLIPGNLTGDTFRDALKELTQTLEITFLIVDEQTILLTSFDAAFERTDLEVYSFKKLLKGKVTEDQALAILNQSLAEELKNPLIRSYYSKRLQGLFVVAPQMLHKKIDAILRALEAM